MSTAPLRPRSVRRLGAGLVLAVVAGLAGCGQTPGPPEPIGVLTSGSETIIFIGRQCENATYPNRVRVSHVSGGEVTEPALWEIFTTTPGQLPSVVLGKLPDTYNEQVNNIASQGPGGTLRVEVDMPERVTATFDLSDAQPGKVLDATGELVSVDSFRATWGCPAG